MMQSTPDESPEPLTPAAAVAVNETIVAEHNDTLALATSDPEPLADFPSPADHYKIVIEDARALGDRRDAINTMFVNIVSLIAGGAGYVLITYPGSTAGLAVILAAAIFGWRLCHVWDDAIGNYKYLLNFRYETLKQWEQLYDYPSLRQYYRSEDFLYDGPGKAPKTSSFVPTKLSDSMPKIMRGKAGNFVNLYVALPQAARVVFFVLALLQVIAFSWRIGSPYLLQLPGPWRLLPAIKL